jgi:outer membrane protein assembly factor BamE (lipoprotein component of BamABCDE complex)
MKTALLLVLLLLASCATVGTPISKDAFAQIKRGETTKAQVIALLGNPQLVSRTDDGEETFSYHYAHVGFGGTVDQQFISVCFGKDDVVTKAVTIDQPR